MYRTHTCGQITKKDVGSEIMLAGWVHARRDHGGLIFIDLRDRYGITQITFNPEKNPEAWKLAEELRAEFVIQVTGTVVARPEDMVNKHMTTGEVELMTTDLEILSRAQTPPFEIGNTSVNEELRLTYRYLDLRDARLQKIMADRDRLITHVREYFHKNDFIEVQTPILANSSPEGARDFLVPSRAHPGKFYALPQAPQQFKQLLMVAGLDRYFQIAPCFRDEDARADRHPGDFYQIDLEMSFVTQEDVWNMVEPLMIDLTKTFSDKEIVEAPFPRISYWDAMKKYGSDKPDLRFEFEIVDISEIVAQSEFKVFKDALALKNGIVNALKIDDGAKFSRSEIDSLTEVAREKGAKGLAYIIYEDKPRSPILKFMTPAEIEAVTKTVNAQKGDIVFFGADTLLTASKSLGAVRGECGERLGLKDPKKASWLWVTDFPMYEITDEGKVDFSHNPFSMPDGGMEALETRDPLEITANQYDLVCNGYEISSGAIRNHKPEIMYKAFELVGYSKEDVDKKFGHMIKAFEYGAPPHGGIAPGLDRILMVLFDLPNIRDIYAFPKNGNAQDLMLGSPSTVDEKQLKELGINIVKKV
ncbi:MAG: aspartate--tRNA ligase [bacterium]|nr:aspartate--tRNA ligase [bacterium]